MEEDILTQDEDLIEEEMREEEKEETKVPKKVVKKTPTKEEVVKNPEKIEETYEAFHQEERLGIVNTLTGDVIDGFDPKRDEGLVKLGKVILNQLNKISISTGA